MDSLVFDQLEQIKKRIADNVAVNDEVVCGFCDELITLAKTHKEWQSVAYGHVWRADYFFYVVSDLKAFSKELDIAKIFIDERIPSELLEKYYTLKHLFYENTFDLQSAFRYVLKALSVSEKLDLGHRIGANYGNIGAYYLDIAHYEEALLYTKKALDKIRSLPDSKPLLIRLLLANLVTINSKLGQLDMAKQFLVELSLLPIDRKDLKIYIDYGYLLYYSKKSNLEKSLFHLNEMFEDGLMEAPKAFAFEFLSESFESMLQLKQKDKAKYLLDILYEKIEENECNALLSLCKLKIKYEELFGSSKELNQCYKEYYRYYMAAQEKTNEIKIEGLYTKVELREMNLKNDQSQKELKELSDLANFDELTKVYNRRYLNIREEEILNSQSNPIVGFALFDIDYFKEYNDFNGHLSGDELLRNIGVILKENLTTNMEAFRYGGDEFVCLCWDTTLDELKAYVERVQASLLKNKFAHPQSRCASWVTMSIGYGNRPVTSRIDLATLFEEVDNALYEAKKNGRNSKKSFLELTCEVEGLK